MASEQKRLFLALILSGLVLFTWQTYFAPKKPVMPNNDIQKTVTDSPRPVQQEQGQTNNNTVDSTTNNNVANTEISQHQLVNSEGGSLKVNSDFSIADIKDTFAKDLFSKTLESKKPLRFFINDNNNIVPLNFLMTSSPDGIKGFDAKNGVNLTITAGINGLYRWKLSSDREFRPILELESKPKEDESRQMRQFVHLQDSVERYNIDSEEVYEGSSKWVGIDYHYHLFAVIFDKAVDSQTFIKSNKLLLKTLRPEKEFSGNLVYTIKEFEHLKKVGHKLDLSIDYGIFGIIAVPLLNGLKFFYSYIPNYGLAIILLTLLIRTLLFPLQFKSFKSMKKMQKLQPQLQKVKEKYKDDPQRVQKETMELFKKNGANPLGGCLPMLMQMPVFFAMYQVFLHSVELVNQPFAFWIHDLSIKDPFYVLPVLMGASFFLQTKLNPSTTTDPSQQKIMLIMPLIFPFFMKDLPAGLNLYMFVSTAFGIIQQMIVYKVIDD